MVAAYEKTTWLNRIGRGAFVRADDQNIDWTGGLYAFQKLKTPIIAPAIAPVLPPAATPIIEVTMITDKMDIKYESISN